MKLFSSNYCQNPYITAAVHYFHYNSHHHYHDHHFHYHCEMHLCRLRILLTIPLDCNMITCLFQLKFVLKFFFRHIFFSSLIPSFSFIAPSKKTQNLFTTIRQILDILFCTYIYVYTYLHLLAYNYLHFLIYTYVIFTLLYELDKIVKIWEI